MQAKMETAAEKYRRIKAEKAEKLTEVACSCGMTWQCKRQDTDFWIRSGIMPGHLAATFITLKKQGKLTDDDIMRSLNEEQFVHGIEFQSKVVRHTAVEPKIVEKAQAPDEIGFDEVDKCCYYTLRDWQLTGGDEATSLNTFPQE